VKQAAKAIALVLLISLLSGCSSSAKPTDKPQVKSECDEVKKTYDDFTKALTTEPNTTITFRKLYLTKNYYLLENPKCFTSVQIAAARAEIIIATR
jgi:hypothetical protein